MGRKKCRVGERGGYCERNENDSCGWKYVGLEFQVMVEETRMELEQSL